MAGTPWLTPSTWCEMFRDEWFVRVGYHFDEMDDPNLFFHCYGDTPHEAAMRLIAKYDMTDLTGGKTVYYVISDEDGAFLVENDPGNDYVLWLGTDKFDAESNLCKCCD